MIKVVADTNVLISAVNYGGVCEQVLKLAREGNVELLTSPEILSEFGEVLYRKFEFSPQRAREAMARIRMISTLVFPIQKLSITKGHDPDNRVLECAIEGQAQYIISGDEHHILPLKEYQGIKILSPAEFLKSI